MGEPRTEAGGLRTITDPRQVDRDAWCRFVDEHPHGTTFHRPEMLEVYTATRRDAPVFAALIRADGSIAGLMLGVLQRSLPGPLGVFTARAIFWGAPLVARDDAACLRQLLNAYEASYGSRAVYSQFRHLWASDAIKPTLAEAGYDYEDHLDVIMDLTLSQDERWKRLKHMRRKNVKKAAREGVEFHEIESEADVHLAHDYIRQLYTRIRLPLPHASYFEAIRTVLWPARLARYFGAYHQGRLIAARIVLCHRAWMYDFWAGGDDEVADLQGGTTLPWAILEWGADRGYRTFDFGGAGKPGVAYGVRDYKLAYGGELVCYGRHTRIHRPLLYKAGSAAVTLLRATAGRRKTSTTAPQPTAPAPTPMRDQAEG